MKESVVRHSNGLASVTRRKLTSLGAAGLLSLLGLLPPTVKSANAQVVLGVLTAAAGVLNIIASYTKTDGGLSAMLNAQNALLQLAINQLGEIQDRIADLSLAVSRIGPETRQALADQYRIELSAKIGGAADDYRSLLTASQTDAGVFGDQQTILILNRILGDAETGRRELTQVPSGFGPEAALVAPVAFSLEIAAQQRLGVRRSIIIARLTDYERWFANMLGTTGPSIWLDMQETIKKHDDLISVMVADPWMKDLGIDKFSLSGEQSSSGLDTCMGFHNIANAPGDDRRDAFTQVWSEGSINGGAYAYQRRAEISAEVDSVFGAKMIHYHLEDPTYSYKGLGLDPIQGAPLINGPLCHIVPGSPKLYSQDTVKSFAEGVSWYNNIHTPDRSRLIANLEVLNAFRARLAFSVVAQTVAANCLTAVDDHRRFLLGG